MIGGRSVPPWKKFLAVSANKQSLTRFFCEYIVSHGPAQLSPHPEWKLFLAGGFKDGKGTKCVTSSGVEDMPDMFSTQEEADTRILLHAAFANSELGPEMSGEEL